MAKRNTGKTDHREGCPVLSRLRWHRVFVWRNFARRRKLTILGMANSQPVGCRQRFRQSVVLGLTILGIHDLSIPAGSREFSFVVRFFLFTYSLRPSAEDERGA